MTRWPPAARPVRVADRSSMISFATALDAGSATCQRGSSAVTDEGEPGVVAADQVGRPQQSEILESGGGEEDREQLPGKTVVKVVDKPGLRTR